MPGAAVRFPVARPSAADPFIDLTEGSIAFVGAGGVAAEDNENLFYDFATKRLGIGTASPGQNLAGGISDLMGVVSHTKNLSSASHLVSEGQAGSFVQLIHLGAAANKKWLQFEILSGKATFRSLNDNGAFRRDNILVLDMDLGTVRIGSTLQVDAGLSAFGATPPASQPAAIADASGGATVDAEARTAINALLAVMRANGLIDT